MAGDGEGRSGPFTEQQTGPLQEELGNFGVGGEVWHCWPPHFLLQVLITRASPVGTEDDNSFSQRRFDDVPVGVSDEVSASTQVFSYPVRFNRKGDVKYEGLYSSMWKG